MKQTTDLSEKANLLQKISQAPSLRKMIKILSSMGISPILPLYEERIKEKNKSWMQIFLAIMVTIVLAFVATESYFGGNFIFGKGGGYITLAFVALDVVIITLLATGRIKALGQIIFVLAVETVSLFYFGYSMKGSYGQDNIKTVAGQKIAEIRKVANQEFTNAVALARQQGKVVETGTIVAHIEKERDGKGIIFDKATLIGEMHIDSPKVMPEVSAIPTFKNLGEANTWLQGQTDDLEAYCGTLQSQEAATIAQDSSLLQGLQQALAYPLSDLQKNDLQMLTEQVKGVAGKKVTKKEFPKISLAHKDLVTDDSQSMVGYVADGVVFIILVLLAFIKSASADKDKIREEVIANAITALFEESGIRFGPDVFKNNKSSDLIMLLKDIFFDQTLLEYLKKNGSFEDYIFIDQKDRALALSLGESQWKLSEIVKALKNEDDTNFASNAEKIVKIPQAEWKMLSENSNNPLQIFEMGPDMRKRFIGIITQIKGKVPMSAADLKQFVSDLIYDANPSEEFIKSLEVFVKKCPPAQIKMLKSEFLALISPEVAGRIVELVTNDNAFEAIVKGWNTHFNTQLGDALSNGVSTNPDFNRLLKLTLGFKPIEGLTTLVDAYNKKKEEKNHLTRANVAIKIQPDYEALDKAIKANNETGFLALVAPAFSVEDTPVA